MDMCLKIKGTHMGWAFREVKNLLLTRHDSVLFVYLKLARDLSLRCYFGGLSEDSRRVWLDHYCQEGQMMEQEWPPLFQEE